MKRVTIELPEILEKFRDKIEQTIKPYINIKLQEQKTMHWEKKIGRKSLFGDWYGIS